jgi:glutamate racemase
MPADDPIAVLAGGTGAAVAAALRALLPHEDLVVAADGAYAPHARLAPARVAARVQALAEAVAPRSPKLVVLGSAILTLEAREVAAAVLGAPVVGLDLALPAALALARGRLVAAVVGAGCVRGLPFARAVRRARGASPVAAVEWPFLVALVEGGRAASPEARALVAAEVEALRARGAGAIALACAHAAAVAPLVASAAGPDLPVLDAAALAAARAHDLLVRRGLLARRRRAGRRIELSTAPAGRLRETRNATGRAAP